MKIKWDYIARKDDTAQSILNLVLRQRHADIKAGYKRVGYVVREFKDGFSNEMPGGILPNNVFALSPVTVDKIVEQLANRNLTTYNAVCNHLQKKIGVPYIVRPYIPKDCKRRLRAPEEIRCRLDKLQKTLTRETKDLLSLGAAVAPATSRTSGARDVIHWIYNDGRVRQWDAVLNKLYELRIEQERDRLFHVRRHANDRNMNNCFNEEINGAIAELNWVLVDNPFSSISMPGMSTASFPYQNETTVEYDE
jgi:hypothetical protein